MNVWRLNIKTGAKGVDPRRFCFDNSIMGAGWPVESRSEILSWQEYQAKARQRYKGDKGWWAAVNALYNRIKINDLCWSRDTSGMYYLGRVTSDWEYGTSPNNSQADVVNVRKCEWIKVGAVDAVPGKVVNSFISRRTIQRVADKTVLAFSKFKYNEAGRGFRYEFEGMESDLFSLLQSDDCEDIVGLYLQEAGFSIVPSSCKTDTLHYEFVLKHREDGRKAVVQVKRGDEDLWISRFSNLDAEVYLFTTHGDYVGESASNVHCLDRQDIENFISSHMPIMPDKILTWLRIHEILVKGENKALK